MSRSHRVKVLNERKDQTNYCATKAEGDALGPLPETFGDCMREFGAEDPCPHVRCRHHLYLDIDKTGRIRLNFPEILPESMHKMEETCSLRSAVLNGGMTRQELGEYLNIDRERVRQLEEDALLKAKLHADQLGIKFNLGEEE